MATINSLNNLMENPLIIGLISIAVTIYGPRLSPKLPSFISNAFNSPLFRFIVLTLIIFVGSRDVRVSMVLAILFMILLSIVNHQNIKEDFEKQINEYYVNYNLFQSREHMADPPPTAASTKLDEEDKKEYFVEHMADPPPTAASTKLDEEDKKEYFVEHFEGAEQPCLIERSKLKNINKIAQDKSFDLSSECKSFFSNLESNSQKCFDEFTQKAKKAQSPRAVAEAAANSARESAASS